MAFWLEVAAGFLGNVAAGLLLVSLYVAVQWFLQVTDITITYNWSFDGTMEHPHNIRPNFDIRNLSMSRTYVLANIAYLRGKKPVAPFDNKSVWGQELKPGSISHATGAPLTGLSSLKECIDLNVHVRLQGKRLFWLQGRGPNRPYKGLQRPAFWLRNRLERMAFPME